MHPIQAIDKEKVKVYSRIVVRLDFTDSFPAGLLSSCLLKGDLPKKAQLVKMAKKSSLQATSMDSPLAQGDWYRIDVQNPGMYKLDYEYFSRLNITVNDIDLISIYGNGGFVIPDNKTGPSDSLIEIPRLVIRKNSDGTPHPEDYVVFYGKGVRGWSYQGGNNFQHIINPYTENNCYFFTFSQGIGKQMGTLSGFIGSSPAYIPTHFQEKIFVEQERYNLLNSGRGWVGKLFIGTDNTDTYRNSLPGLVDSLPITYRFNFLHRSESLDILKVFENEVPLGGSVEMAVHTTDVDLEPSSPYAEKVEFTYVRNNSSGMLDDVSIVKIRVESSNQESKTWLDWFEIFYNRKFEALSDALLFTTSPEIEGIVQYSVSNLPSSEIYAFDVTEHSNVKQITQLQIVTDVSAYNCNFQLMQKSDSVRKIAVVGKNGFITPSIATRIENSNIHVGPPTAVEFIIISPPEFLTEAYKLRDYRVSHDSISTLVVDINQIYNEFSGGLPDPLAIREFLRYTRDNWESMPKYVLLFGWGHYDYKNLSTSQRNWIPPYETAESIIPMNTHPTDDKFVILDPSGPYTMAVGRLPARNLGEVKVMVNKIISYDTTAPDSWRNRITFVADDGKTSLTDEGDLYTTNSENIAESEMYIPKSFEKKKIYIVEYPTVNSASGRRKPDANKAIVDAINQGTLITNYIGHGNERVWAHETIFTREDNLPQLMNQDRLTFIVAATCNFWQVR